jgi:hypothetical protein
MPTPLDLRPASRRRHCPRLAWHIATSLALASCSTQTPQIFSDTLLSQRAAEGPAPDQPARGMPTTFNRSGDISVEAAIQEAQTVQRQYLQAVKDLSEVGTGTSAALIGLSALGLAHGLTHPNAHALTQLGVVGGATYAYGSTLTSRPRQQLFLVGAETLNCAIAASRPYALPKGWLIADGVPGSVDNSLEGLAGQAEAQARVLRGSIDVLTLVNHDERRIDMVGKPAPDNCGTLPACPASTSTDPDRVSARSQCLRRQANEQARCAGPRQRETVLSPSPEVPARLQELTQARRQLLRLATVARQQVLVFAGAGNALWQATVDTQVKVAREVLKTEPDLSAVLTAAQGIKGTGFLLSGATALRTAPPPAGTASAPTTARGTAHASKAAGAKTAAADPATSSRPPPIAALQAAREQIDSAQLIADQLQARLQTLAQRATAGRIPLERCGQGLGEARLTLSPDIGEITLAPGQSRSFLVSGGTGSAQGVVLAQAGAPSGGLTRNLDGAFVYRVPDAAADGASVVLRFNDGSGRLSREVTVHIAHAPGSPGTSGIDIKTQDLKALAAALGLAATTANAKEVAMRAEVCLRDTLGVASPDLQRIAPDHLARILAGACRG